MGYESETTAFLERQVAEWTQTQKTTVAYQARWLNAQQRARGLEGALWLTWFWLLVAASVAFEWILWLTHPATFNPIGALISSLFVAFVVAVALDLVTVLRLMTIFSAIMRATLRKSARFRVNLFRRSVRCTRCYRRIYGPYARCSAPGTSWMRQVRREDFDPDTFAFPFTLRGDYHPTCLCEDAQAGTAAAARAASHRLLLTREALTTHQRLDAMLAAAVESDAADAKEDAARDAPEPLWRLPIPQDGVSNPSM